MCAKVCSNGMCVVYVRRAMVLCSLTPTDKVGVSVGPCSSAIACANSVCVCVCVRITRVFTNVYGACYIYMRTCMYSVG